MEMVCVCYSGKMWKETRWDHVCDPSWWEITVVALMDVMYRISWNSNLMWAPVEPNGTSSNQANSVRKGGLCVNTAETILPSELTEKTHLCWRGTDDQRRTCRKRHMGWGEGGGLKRGEWLSTNCPFQRGRWRESEGTEYRMRNKWQEWAYKRKWSLGLESGWNGRLWNSLSQVWWDCYVQPLIMLRCKEQGLQTSTRSRAELHSKSNRDQVRLLEVITSNYMTSHQIKAPFNIWTEHTEGEYQESGTQCVLCWPHMSGNENEPWPVITHNQPAGSPVSMFTSLSLGIEHFLLHSFSSYLQLYGFGSVDSDFSREAQIILATAPSSSYSKKHWGTSELHGKILPVGP